MIDKDKIVAIAHKKTGVSDVDIRHLFEHGGFFKLIEAASNILEFRGTGSKACRPDYAGIVPNDKLTALYWAVNGVTGSIPKWVNYISRLMVNTEDGEIVE